MTGTKIKPATPTIADKQRPRRWGTRGLFYGIAPVCRKEFLHVTRDPGTLFFALLIPMLQLFLFGFAVDLMVLVDWLSRHMAALDAMRPALFAMTFMVLGLQVVFGSFFLGLFRMRVHAGPARSSQAS